MIESPKNMNPLSLPYNINWSVPKGIWQRICIFYDNMVIELFLIIGVYEWGQWSWEYPAEVSSEQDLIVDISIQLQAEVHAYMLLSDIHKIFIKCDL